MQYVRNALFGWKGYWEFTADGFKKSKATFDAEALNVNLKNKVAMVTGFNSGLGFATAQALAKLNATLHLVCRSKEKGEEAIAKIKSTCKDANITLHLVDLSDIEATKKFALEFAANQDTSLHILVNNAGALPNERIDNKQGFNYTLALNTLSAHILTRALQPLLAKSGSQSDPSRVIVVSSGGMYTSPLNVNDFNFLQLNPFNGSAAYAQTKRQQVILNRLYASKNSYENKIVYFSMHPGWCATDGVKTSLPGFYNKMKDSLRTADEGADTIVWLAASKQVSPSDSGKFFFDRQVTSEHLTLAYSEESMEDAEKLWDFVEQVYSKY